MKIFLQGISLEADLQIRERTSNGSSAWIAVHDENQFLEIGEAVEEENLCYRPFRIYVNSRIPTQVRLYLHAPVGRIYHVIPANIFGDNNAATTHPGEFPHLTAEGEDLFNSPYWEFRADRAPMPISAVCGTFGTLAVSIDPYAMAEEPVLFGKEQTGPLLNEVIDKGFTNGNPGAARGADASVLYDTGKLLHNGVFASLPDGFGVTLGYTNDPFSFINKRNPGSSTWQAACRASAEGRIYFAKEADEGRRSIHRIIRREYEDRREKPAARKKPLEAVRGITEAFTRINWSDNFQEYTNENCLPPADTCLKPWRQVLEIGWTGGGVLGYPLTVAEYILKLQGMSKEKIFGSALDGAGIFNRIAASYNERSGLLYDLVKPIDESGSRLNGWWSGFGLAKDVHCSYNVGSALHYMLKTIAFLQDHNLTSPSQWLDTAVKVMDTVIALQRCDGAFGYTYRSDRKEVADWDGFAGCWFIPCAAYLYHLTGKRKYQEAADKALKYYGTQVRALHVYGTPMDTWKAVDQEGNLAYIRGARLLHEYTGKQEYLTALKDGADYEMLWRYGYRTKPDFRPLNDGWNSCGGSVTSVSNPHIHPMGVIVDSDLYYLAKQIGDNYYRQRAEDSVAWLFQTLELYPDKTGYGAYGVMSERWCPSDGLVVQRDSEGKPYSSWFSFNLWAGAAALEEACERTLMLDEVRDNKDLTLLQPASL